VSRRPARVSRRTSSLPREARRRSPCRSRACRGATPCRTEKWGRRREAPCCPPAPPSHPRRTAPPLTTLVRPAALCCRAWCCFRLAGVSLSFAAHRPPSSLAISRVAVAENSPASRQAACMFSREQQASQNLREGRAAGSRRRRGESRFMFSSTARRAPHPPVTSAVSTARWCKRGRVALAAPDASSFCGG